MTDITVIPDCFSSLKTPCYIIDENRLIQNLQILSDVEKHTGCRILLAQKAFSCYEEYPLIGQYLSGTTASGLYEARLGKEEMGKENHIFSPAYRDCDIDELAAICDHIIFNSPLQVSKYAHRVKQISSACSIGIRINPECSTQHDHAIYDPCAPGSRLGALLPDVEQNFDKPFMRSVEGIHFHTLCEQGADDLITTLDAVENSFGHLLSLPQIKWLNMGGGHHITRRGYDISALERAIIRISNKYNVQVYLEPGEAVALDAGYFMTTILDTVTNGIKVLILDGSAACHMPDVLEMPYRPPLLNSGEPGVKRYTCRLSGNTCLSGDIIGDYSFDYDPKPGNRLLFQDMAIYSMVKNNTFNGIPLPDIYRLRDDQCTLIKSFGYNDFKSRL